FVSCISWHTISKRDWSSDVCSSDLIAGCTRTWNDGHMRIAIVGAGIGGLSAAAGLQRAGAEVTVFERASELRAGGSGLSLFANRSEEGRVGEGGVCRGGT